MIFIVVFLIIKIALFWFPYSFWNIASSQHMILDALDNQKTMEVSYRLPSSDGQQKSPEIVVTLPEIWQANKIYTVLYEIKNWENPQSDVEIRIYSAKGFDNFGSPVIFKPGGATRIEHQVLLYPNTIEDKIIQAEFVGEMKIRSDKSNLQSSHVTILNQKTVDSLRYYRVVNFIVFIITLILAVVFLLFAW